MIIKKFEEQVEAFADRIVLKTGNEFLTYVELNRYSNKVASEIITGDQTMGKNEKNCNVSLLFEHGSHMIVGIIGALKANKTFVPLDVNYPQKRLLYMLEHSESHLILTNHLNLPLAETLIKQSGEKIGLLIIDNTSKAGPGNNIKREAASSRPAYILYTSGSTGKPKGAVQSHENVIYFIDHWTRRFSITGSDRITLLASLSHDGAIPDIFASLLNGAALYPYDIKKKPNISDLIDWLQLEKITIWHSVPTFYRHFIQALSGNEVFPDLRLLVLGGEEVRTHDVTMFKTYFPQAKFANIYGQTESTVNSIWLLSQEDSFKKIIIGTPIGETKIFLVDDSGAVVEEMGVGEIVIASGHVALAYWKDKENSKKVFTANKELGRLYWTGDLGRLNADGSITISGRKDFQVKIRGFRVETGEIETVLLKHPAIKEAVTTAKEDENGDNYLCAYIVSDESAASSGFREFLGQELPDYMLPRYFVNLEKMPLTASGKVDRKVLPVPDSSAQPKVEYEAPTNEIEKKLIVIWQEILRSGEIGLHSNFFELGGHSLLVITLISNIHQAFNVELQLKDIFDYPTLKELSQLIIGSGQTLFSSIKPLEKKEYYHLSSAQKRLYILNQQDSGNTAYNLPSAVKIEGPLNIDMFEETIQALIRRHESLRTSFQTIKGELVQIIEQNPPFNIDYFDLTGGTTETEIVKVFIKPFDLSKAPLLRVGLIEWSQEEHLLLMDMQHIITDGVSLDILVREFVYLYAGIKPVELRLQYKDFSEWQKDFFESAALKQQEKYWSEYLKGELPRLEMPLDFLRPTRQTFEGTKISFTIPTGIMEKLNTFAREKNVTLNIIFLSLYFLLLSKYSNQDDITVGSLVAGRNHADLENIIGMFGNFLPIRCRIDPNSTFPEFLDLTGRIILDAYENQDYPFEKMIDLLNVPVDLSRNPLFDTMLIFHNETDPSLQLETDDLKFIGYPLPHTTSKLDFKIDVSFGKKGELNCILEYNIGLFKEETIKGFIRHFYLLVGELIERPHQKVSEIEIFTKEEKLKLSEKRKHNTPSANRPLRLVVSATFTAEPINDYIKWWGNHFGLDIDVVFAPYNQVFQELLNEKSLTSINQGINLLLIRFEDWIRDLSLTGEKRYEKLESDFRNLIKIFKDKPKTVPYFVGIFPAATHLGFSPKLMGYLEDMYGRWKEQLQKIDNVYVVDFTSLKELYAVGEVFDPIADKEGHLPFSSEFVAAMGTTIARKICTLNNNPFKVIILDCDDTLWQGICGEDGPLGVSIDAPYLELQRFMIQKYKEGFLLALCSKNNEADVWEVFENNPGMLLKKEHFVCWKINWQSKSINIKELTVELNLGIESFIFVDDSPVECSEVITHCPEVFTLQLPENPESIPLFLNHVWAFDKIKVTEEDRSRTQMYLAEKKRQKAEKESLTLNNFLADLQLKVSMNEMKPSQVSRVSQLTLRTNQFNLSTRRRKEHDILNLVKEPDTKCWVIQVKDRFGEYGLTGVVITKERKESLFIDTLLLSCRVLGRRVEETILAGLRKYCEPRQLKILEADYYPTPKNKPLLEFLENKWIHKQEYGEYCTYIYPFENRWESLEFVDFYYQQPLKKEVQQETVGKEEVLLDHIAVAVTHMEPGVSYYRAIGYDCGELIYDPIQRSNLVMCRKPGCDSIELVSAADSHSPTLRITTKNGDCPYHLCYRVRDIKDFLKSLEQQDIPFEIVDDLKPAVLFDNKKVMFLQVKDVGLVELLEDKEGDFNLEEKERIKNNTVRMVVPSPDHPLTFYKHLGYIQVKNVNSPRQLEIALEKAGAGRIELIVPKEETLKEYAFLSKNGPHLYQLCLDEECPEGSVSTENSNEMNVEYIRYRKRPKQPPISPGHWAIKTGNMKTGKLLHKNQLLPLQNYTAEMLLRLPTYKVDEKLISRVKYEKPRNRRESKLVEIWQKILKVERIGVNESFFELGGNSLKAITLISEMHKALDVELSLKNIFDSKTIKALANLISDSEINIYSPLEAAEEKEYYLLSSAQKRLYILQQMEPKNTGYNMATILRLEGNVDRGRLEDAFRKSIKWHESLRTSFEIIEGEPVQKIHDAVGFEIEYYDITEVEEPHSSYLSHSPGVIIKNFVRPFDLVQAPLLRTGLVNTGDGKYILMVDMHHIISDGVSHAILVQELIQLYIGEELSPLKLQYKDYSEWQNYEKEKKAIKQQEKYWQKEFEGEIPILSLPTDCARPAIQSFEGSTVNFEIGSEDTIALKTFALSADATLYMVLLAVYNIFLSKISNQEDIIVGTALAGRRNTELQKIIGVFVNTLALKNNPKGEKTFMEFLKEIKERTLDAFANQDYQYEDLVEQLAVQRDVSHNPLFDVMFVLQNIDIHEVEVPGLKLLPYEYEKNTSKFDLSLQAFESEEHLSFTFEYSTKLFKESTIHRFITYFKKIVSAIKEYSGKELSQVEIIPEEERQHILYVFNDTTAGYPREKTIPQLFENQVEKTPDHVAAAAHSVGAALGGRLEIGEPRLEARCHVPPDHISLTYWELNGKSNQFARMLRENGVGADTIVGLMVDRSIQMIIGLYGILKAGGAYMPVAPNYPPERVRYMLEDSGSRLLLTQEKYMAYLTFSGVVINLDDESLYHSKESGSSKWKSSSEDLVYVIYTSGSTGKPKGVPIKTEGFVNLVYWYVKEFKLNAEDKFLLIAPISFDLAQKNLFAPLITGGCLCLASPGLPDYDELSQFIALEQQTVVNCAPSVFYPFVEFNMDDGFKKLKSLRYVFLGGEPIQMDKLMSWINSEVCGCEIVNTYGPTECTDVVSYYRIPGEKVNQPRIIPIGKPVDNVTLYVLDKRQKLLPVGLSGEVCIGGIGLASGYCNNGELTGEKFIQAPHLPQERIYRTGDLGRWLPDGNIEFLGRIDHQVKIRGLRLELGEIESQLLEHDEIKEAVVLSINTSKGRDLDHSPEGSTCGEKEDQWTLFAYIVSNREFSTSELREYLSKELPCYMIPSYFVQVDRIPLTPSGKIDRRSLQSFGTELGTGVEFVAPRNAIEEKIANIWMEVLKLDKVGVDENFFDLGGSSLDIIKLNVKFKEAFDVDESVVQMFRYTTINSFARYLSQKRSGAKFPDLMIDKSVQIEKIKKTRASQKSKRRGNINV